MSAMIESAGRTLAECEQVISQGVEEIGRALREIRDHRLYRDAGYPSFEVYCRNRWSLGRSMVNKKIAAATVIQQLGALPDNKDGMGTNVPKTEGQARPLAGKPKAVVVEAWKEATRETADPTEKQVREALAKVEAAAQLKRQVRAESKAREERMYERAREEWSAARNSKPVVATYEPAHRATVTLTDDVDATARAIVEAADETYAAKLADAVQRIVIEPLAAQGQMWNGSEWEMSL